jgi:iron-sulfur cluster assembly protein
MKITVTEAAARQIGEAAKQGDTQGMALRIAAKRKQDGSIDYAMGFDEAKQDDDRVEVSGIDIVVAPTSSELLNGMTLDFVELEPGTSEFIFLNPNDSHYIPPKP